MPNESPMSPQKSACVCLSRCREISIGANKPMHVSRVPISSTASLPASPDVKPVHVCVDASCERVDGHRIEALFP
jgi:hypothetical protein